MYAQLPKMSDHWSLGALYLGLGFKFGIQIMAGIQTIEIAASGLWPEL